MLLDHIFIMTEPGAAIAKELIDIGLVEGTSNTHPGQGTANRRFFLNGFTIEFLYIDDANEAQTGAGKDLKLYQRSRVANASPFGIVVRVPEKTQTPAFPHWLYFPDYFKGVMSFHVGENSEQLEEPLCICMPPQLPKASNIPDELLNSDWTLTQVEIDLPVPHPSPTLQCFEILDGLTLQYNKPHHLALTINDRKSGNEVHLTPRLPVSLFW